MKLQATEEGHYYRKQLGCKSWLIAWSHTSRFKMALKLIGNCSAKRVLDYGCGDGTFLAFASDRILEGCGADVAADQIADCQVRLRNHTNVRFCMVNDLNHSSYNASFDVVTCMETLEHCTKPTVELVLSDLARLCAPGGHIVISVPIETGPTFLAKYFARKFAAFRGLSEYRHYESYSVRNALKMIFASRRTQLERPVYGEDGPPYHSHYGFNWRNLRQCVSAHLHIDTTLFSPVGLPGGLFSSQAWFVCKPQRTQRSQSTITADSPVEALLKR
jgi:2-polyprenyl-3-methyl-5-hydroxy-6-metoxy-1,4-benzoquinol methylase